MPNKTLLAGAASLLGTLALSGSAFAGHCGPGQNCNMDVRVINDYEPSHDAMTVRSTPPGHHYRSIQFQGAPNVSITRVHGMMSNAGLSDAPSAFTGGCHPESTAYCRTDMGTPVTVEMAPRPAPAYRTPIVQAPAPVIMAPKPAPQLRTWVGKGYDPSKFTPNTYGDATLVPGIAYLPTSKVVRDPAAAQAVLDSGRAVPQSRVMGGTAPNMSMVRSAPNYSVTLPVTHRPAMGSVTLPVTHRGGMGYSVSSAMGGTGSYGPTPPAVLTAPAVAYDGNGPRTILQQTPFAAPAQAPVHAGNNTYMSNIGADGTYWEKTSGLTTFGSTVATQVICKRKVEQKVVNPMVGVPVPVPTRVVNPVVGVPVAVPTPVEVPYCAAAPMPHPHGPRGHMAPSHPRQAMHNRYAQPMAGRWVR